MRCWDSYPARSRFWTTLITRLHLIPESKTKIKSARCTDCNQPMEMVELHNVPGDEIRNFINIPGNKPDDNWYWCPKCDTYRQETQPIKLSPDIAQLARLLESFSNNW